MRDLLQTKRIPILLTIALLLSITRRGWTQDIQIPPDITLECGDEIPVPDEDDVVINSLQCLDDLSAETICDDAPVTPLDGCYASTEECFQVALVCIDFDENGFPIYKFKVYNACGKDMSNIAFSLPVTGMVEVPSGPLRTDFSSFSGRKSYKSCEKEYNVEAPQGGPDEGTVKFEGGLAPGESVYFVYKVPNTDLQEEIIVNPKAGNGEFEIEIEVEDCDESIEVKDIEIEIEETGDQCSGRTIKHIYTIYFSDDDDEYESISLVRTITVFGSDQGLEGECPVGESGLTDLSQVPDPESYEDDIRQAFSNACTDVSVTFLNQKEIPDDCGGYTVEQRFKIEDECGNRTTCKIIHIVEGVNNGDHEGLCPEDDRDLSCESEVPSPGQLEQQIAEAYDGRLNISIAAEKSGDNCQGFRVRYNITLKNECGQEKHCSVIFEGEDNTPPSGACPPTNANLDTDADYIAYFKENWTDNCGNGIYRVEKLSETRQESDCGSYTITKEFGISDKCGNTATCTVTHTENGGGAITGTCPPTKDNLSCLAEVPTADEVEAMILDRFTGADGGEVSTTLITEEREGDECEGFTVNYKFNITDNCGNETSCRIRYSGKDETAPAGQCPRGANGLTSISEVPEPASLIGDIENAYADNCSDEVVVTFIDSETTDLGNCGDFQVVQRFEVADRCGNATICSITHKGSSSGEITGTCPPTKDNLSCLAEVPTADEVEAMILERFTGGDGGEVSTTLVINEREGDECEGFTVNYKFNITDNCGNETSCRIRYSGKDETAPAGQCPRGATGLTSISEVPEPASLIGDIENAYADNCSDEVVVTFIDSETTDLGNCGDFQVVQRFEVADQCGNATICSITHKGNRGGEITGVCPPTKDNLSCLAEVPTADEVEAMILDNFTGGDGGEVSVRLTFDELQGDECEGFVVSYQFEITDNCGDKISCWIRYSGKDEEPPTFTTELPDQILGCDDSSTFDTPEAVDNCGGEVIVKKLEDMFFEGDCEGSYSVVRTWFAIDACGNVSDPLTQIVTVPEACCEAPPLCAYTPFYWGQNVETGSPSVQKVLEANGGNIQVGDFTLDLSCIDVVLPGAPLATNENLNESCQEGLVSSSLIRHTLALTLNILNNPALCELRLRDLPCPIDLEFFGYGENSTVCDLLADANEAIAEEWYDCELADAMAAVNECLSCDTFAPEGGSEGVDDKAEGPTVKLTDPSAIERKLEVAPNPSPSPVIINVQYAGFNEGNVWVYVHNINGDLVHKVRGQEGGEVQLTLDMSGLRLPGGTYVITVSSREASLSRKVIVK